MTERPETIKSAKQFGYAVAAGSPGGMNFGWPCREGHNCRGSVGCSCENETLVAPVHDYEHAGAACIMGGYVYRGSQLCGREGWYFFADYNTGQLWALTHDGTKLVSLDDLTDELSPSREGDTISSIDSFGEGNDGELYIITLGTDDDGAVYRIVSDADAPTADIDADGTVGFVDLIAVLSNWGPCVACPADIDADGVVGFQDLIAVLSNWGPTCGAVK